jgi:hypothetical protein
MDESATEWVFEYVHGVFQAPTWEGPIGGFIDENCIVFDDEEENKLSHTEVHQVSKLIGFVKKRFFWLLEFCAR